jgi:hypothetical protein
MKRALVLALLCVAACKKPGDKGGATGPAQASSDAGPSADTAAKVKAYLGYQRGMIVLLAPTAAVDGGVAKAVVLSDEEQARAEGKLRKESGLTDTEIDAFNQVVAALFTRNVMARVAAVASLAPELEKARAELPDGSVPEIDRALATLEEAKKRTSNYDEERARYGSALIDALLPFEQELLANFGAMMNSAHASGEAAEH